MEGRHFLILAPYLSYFFSYKNQQEWQHQRGDKITVMFVKRGEGVQDSLDGYMKCLWTAWILWSQEFFWQHAKWMPFIRKSLGFKSHFAFEPVVFTHISFLIYLELSKIFLMETRIRLSIKSVPSREVLGTYNSEE